MLFHPILFHCVCPGSMEDRTILDLSIFIKQEMFYILVHLNDFFKNLNVWNVTGFKFEMGS